LNMAPREVFRPTFRVVPHGEVWRAFINGALYGDFLTRGDPIRGACHDARASDARGGKPEVLAEGDERVLHYEPHFSA